MKLFVFSSLIALLLASCGKKEEPKPAASKAISEKNAQPPVTQGKLPQMDPEKAKFIAVPNTPKDAEVKKAEKPAVEAKK